MSPNGETTILSITKNQFHDHISFEIWNPLCSINLFQSWASGAVGQADAGHTVSVDAVRPSELGGAMREGKCVCMAGTFNRGNLTHIYIYTYVC